jgi:hypothetical protein
VFIQKARDIVDPIVHLNIRQQTALSWTDTMIQPSLSVLCFVTSAAVNCLIAISNISDLQSWANAAFYVDAVV